MSGQKSLICPRCGTPAGNAMRFCVECGASIPEPTGEGADAAKVDWRKPTQTLKQGPKDAKVVVDPKGRAVDSKPKTETPKAGSSKTGIRMGVSQAGRPTEGMPNKTEFQRLLDEVETGFNAILIPEKKKDDAGKVDDPKKRAASAPTGELPHDAAEARAMFDVMVVAHAGPIRDFMIEVRLGEPLSAWIEFCVPALRMILRSAQGMGIGDFVVKLEAFQKTLELAHGRSDRLLRGEVRQAIIDSYSDLMTFQPGAFGLESESNKRESVIVHALLSQVPDLNKVGIDRIYAAGLTSLGLFYVARPGDISELTGIAIEQARAVVARFSEYRRRVEGISPENSRAAELAMVADFTSALETTTREYDALAETGDADHRRRELRRQRADIMVEIGLVLARLGEVDRLRQLEKLSFAQRVAALRQFAEEMKKKQEPMRP